MTTTPEVTMTLHSLAVLAANPKIDATGAGRNARALLLVVLTLAFLLIAIKTAWNNHERGEMRKAAQSFGVALISLGIAALGATATVALLWGGAILNFFQSIAS